MVFTHTPIHPSSPSKGERGERKTLSKTDMAREGEKCKYGPSSLHSRPLFHPHSPSLTHSLTHCHFIHVAGFDEYFTSLRPPLSLSHCQSSQRPPQESSAGKSRRLNCRNPWFRQFWFALHIHWHNVPFISLSPSISWETCPFPTWEDCIKCQR